MCRIITISILVLISFVGFSQKKNESTNQFTISGLVDKPLRVSYSDLEKENVVNIGYFKITHYFKRI